MALLERIGLAAGSVGAEHDPGGRRIRRLGERREELGSDMLAGRGWTAVKRRSFRCSQQLASDPVRELPFRSGW